MADIVSLETLIVLFSFVERKLSGGTRYLGDWEVKARSHGGSEVKVSANYVPVGLNQTTASTPFRGRGRGDFRGTGMFLIVYHLSHPNHTSI